MSSFITANNSLPHIGAVAWIANNAIEERTQSHERTEQRPHIIVEVSNGIADCVALSTSGDLHAEKNEYHFVPSEACGVLNKPTFVIPHREHIYMPLKQFATHDWDWMNETAVDMVLDIVEYYYTEVDADPSQFAPFKGATYPFSKRRTGTTGQVMSNITTPDIYRAMGMKPRTLRSLVNKLVRR